MTLTETQRKRRGHAFYPPESLVIPGLYNSGKGSVQDTKIVVHYFCASGDWYVAELNRETGEAFGYVRLAAYPEGAEWGYFSLPELEQVNTANGLVIVERDMHWTPRRFSEVSKSWR